MYIFSMIPGFRTHVSYIETKFYIAYLKVQLSQCPQKDGRAVRVGITLNEDINLEEFLEFVDPESGD